MSDLNIIGSGNPPPPEPSAYISPIINSTLPVGTPVYQTATAGEADVGRANAIGTSNLLGLLVQPSAAGARALVQQRGIMNLTVAQWHAIGAAAGGLVAGDFYYLSATSGLISTAKPASGAGNFIVPIGQALNATQMQLTCFPVLPLSD